MSLSIDANLRAAWFDGRDLALGARAFDVLVHLSENADRVVSKEELLDRVWAGRMVEESNLTVQIAGLRKALGRDAIKTVPGVGYKFALADAPAPEPPREAPALPDKPSLVVLPFANLTGSADRDYLVDGIVAEISTALSRVSAFFVISTTSSFTLKGRAVDLANLGRELGVRYVLEGSLQQAGDRLRIFTQLVEAETGRMIWQNRFDGALSEIFELQDSVAESVAATLEPRLVWAENARVRKKPTESLTAHDLCLRAAPLVERQNSLADLEAGLALLEKARALDPDYIYAKGLYCAGHTGAFATRWWPRERAMASLPVAHEVVEAETDDAFSLAYAGHQIAYLGKDRDTGLVALQRAIRINPNSATACLLLGWVHVYRSEAEPAIEHLMRMRRISPLHPQIGVASCGLGNISFQTGHLEEAARWLEMAITEFPEFASSHLALMGVYWAMGRKDDSARLAGWLRARVPGMTVSTFRADRPQTNGYYTDTIAEALEANGFPA